MVLENPPGGCWLAPSWLLDEILAGMNIAGPSTARPFGDRQFGGKASGTSAFCSGCRSAFIGAAGGACAGALPGYFSTTCSLPSLTTRSLRHNAMKRPKLVKWKRKIEYLGPIRDFHKKRTIRKSVCKCMCRSCTNYLCT